MTAFDPNAAAPADSGIFGLPHNEADSRLVIVPVPWDVTTSYRAGAANGPAAILAASRQVDLYDLEIERPYEPGIFLRPLPQSIETLNRDTRIDAEKIIEVGGRIEGQRDLQRALLIVNEASAQVNSWVRTQTDSILQQHKIAAVLGGDHAVPFGAFQSIAEHAGEYGILHFDAHSDTRDAYEGFEWSHASIMRNALDRIPQITKLVQVGIRDVCEDEIDYCREQGNRVAMFSDLALSRRRFAGESWRSVCQSIVGALPDKVWISFDIDGLDPSLCPNTGTPVPGGLDFAQAVFLIGEVARANKTLIGFDLNEVSPAKASEDEAEPNEWDANVGARLLYKLCAFTFASQRLVKPL